MFFIRNPELWQPCLSDTSSPHLPAIHWNEQSESGRQRVIPTWGGCSWNGWCSKATKSSEGWHLVHKFSLSRELEAPLKKTITSHTTLTRTNFDRQERRCLMQYHQQPENLLLILSSCLIISKNESRNNVYQTGQSPDEMIVWWHVLSLLPSTWISFNLLLIKVHWQNGWTGSQWQSGIRKSVKKHDETGPVIFWSGQRSCHQRSPKAKLCRFQHFSTNRHITREPAELQRRGKAHSIAILTLFR